ncbi:MAG: cytochrome c oxidase subunit II [Paracoccaceae bacterium]
MRTTSTLFGLLAAIAALPAMAQDNLEIIGKPIDGKMGFQPAATGQSEGLQSLDFGLLIVITLIVLFVVGLLLYAVVRFNRKANPTPANFTHNTKLEVAWTVVPVFILLGIAVFSLPELFRQQEIPEGDVNIKVTGYQWYWGYEYTDHGFGFDSNLLGGPATIDTDARPADADVRPYVLDAVMEAKLADAGYSKNEFLLATDTAVVVPVNKIIVMTVTGGDVIHSWTIPAFGVKQDGVPGRIAQLWFKPTKEGVYFGQCSELCGKDHAYMPITVKVVSQEAYEAWLKDASDEYAGIHNNLEYEVASN